MSFTAVFGGDNVDPSYLSYVAYSTAVPLTLVWSRDANTSSNVMASKIDVTATAASVTIGVPDATQVSVGRDVLIRNAGATTFGVINAAGATIGTVASGQSWYFYLTNNSTVAGTWQSVQFGAGTSSASAASLAGAGLQAVTTLLNQNLLVTSVPGNYAPGVGDRATALLATGGAVTYSPASAGTLGSGWFTWVINGGTGNVVWTPSGGQLVDGAATKTLAPTESALFFSNGTNFWSAAYGRAVVNTVTGIAINAAALVSPATLSSTQVAAQVQDYSGALLANLIVNYGAGVGFWFVRNNTTGAFTLTARVNGADPGVAVTQGSYSILRSNGSTMSVAFTATSGTVTSVAGSADFTGVPITTSGTLGLSNTGAIAGTYGSATEVSQIVVDAKGRLSSAVAVPIALTIAQIAAFTSADLRGRLSDESGTGLAVFNNAPSLTDPDVSTQTTGNNTTKAASTAFVQATLAASPALGGDPTAATQTLGNNSTRIASTAYVMANTNNFAAAQTVATSLLHGINTKMICNSQTFETGGDYYNPVTGRHTPLIAGQYSYTASAGMPGASPAIYETFIMVYKNGVLIPGAINVVYRPAQYNTTFGFVSALVDMNGTTDYVEIFLYQSNDLVGNASTTPSQCSFSGYRV